MIKSSISEYRVGDNVILKAEGDSATRTVIEVIDPKCQLRVGDSVNDFSNNMDYLNDVYSGGRFVIVSSKKIQSELNHFYDPATDYIDEELTEDEEYKYSQFKVETGYYLTPQRNRIDVYTVYSPNDKYLGQTSNPNEILDLIRGKRVNSSRRNNMIKSSLPTWAKSLSDNDAERRNQLQELYDEAHWEFLDYIMPCDPEWTPDMADGDFNPLSEIHFLFENAQEIESFLANCDYAGIPGAEEKLKRMRQINTWNEAYASGPHPETWEDWSSVKSSRQIKSSKSQEEFENLVIDIEDILGVNVEHSNIFNLPVELTYEDECYIDDICREQNCRFIPVNGSRRKYRLIQSSRRNNMIKSAYTREDYDRFDEVGNFIPYNPTEEELAKKDEIKTVLKQELSDAYEPDPMDNYAGYDSTNERIDMACERVAKQFGVDTDFVEEIAGEIDRENIARAQAEPEYVYQHCKDKDRFWDWYNGEDVSLEELGIDKEQMNREVDEIVHKYVNSSRQIKSGRACAVYKSGPYTLYEESKPTKYFSGYYSILNKNKNIYGFEAKSYEEAIQKFMSFVSKGISNSKQIKSSTVTSDKQFRLIDTEHNDPRDGEDFTAEELRDYISKNDKYFDNAGLDYTIVDLNTGEEMNVSTFRLNSSPQIKSSTVPRTTKELADWMREHTGWNVNYDEKNDVFVSGPEDAQTYIDRKGRVITDGPSGVENHTIEEFMNIMDEKPIKSALDTVKVTFDNGDTIVTDYNADVGREEIAKYYMHNYFNVGGEDEMHQVVKVEFPGNINSARTPEVADMQDAEDLALFAENDHELYDMVIKPTFDSLQRKLKRGIYDKDKALIAWEHVIDEAAKAYDRQLGSKRGTMTMFNKATRKEAAKILMDSIWDEDEWQA